MTTVLAIVFVLGVLIFFHELGHFLVAKALGIGVKTFSLGFGPKIFGFRVNRTDLQISAFPLGGYVKLFGEEQDDFDPRFSDAEDFSKRPPLHRILVVAAGPIFNLLLAWILYFLVFLNVGQQMLTNEIGGVVDGSPAQAVGLKKGDKIIEINGKPITYWDDIVDIVSHEKRFPLRFKIKRGDRTLLVKITPRVEKTKNIFGEEIKVNRVGIIAANKWVHINLSAKDATLLSFKQTWVVTKLTFEGIVKLVERVVPIENIGGPIMIAQLVSSQAKAGFFDLLALTALISINLGLLNLLPIPVLDGGHLLFYSLEIITRRPLSPEIKKTAMKIGLGILIGLMMLAVYNDINRLMGPNIK